MEDIINFSRLMKKRFTPNGKKVVFASSLPGKSYSLSPLLLGEVACNPWLAKMSLHQPYGSFVYNYLCNQCRLSLLKLWVITAHGQVYSIQLYMIEFVCDLQHIEGFLWVLWFPPPIYLTAAMITEIVLNVVLNTHNSNPKASFSSFIVEQELLTLPEHLTSPLVFSGVRVTRSFVLLLFFLAIVLSVLLWYTDSDCPFGIFKLFLYRNKYLKLQIATNIQNLYFSLSY